MRRYQPLWNAIRTDNKVSIAAPADTHRKIILGVRKEKTKDIGWKLQCLEERKRYKLIDKSEGNMVEFHLEETNHVSYATLTANDL